VEQLYSTPSAALNYLRSAMAVRERCRLIYDYAVRGELQHFILDESKLASVAERVTGLIRRDYPTLAIPYHSRWRHFGERRTSKLTSALSTLSAADRARTKLDLAIVSVLLDAGAGMQWRYTDLQGEVSSRSEGLARASFDAILRGDFSNSRQDISVDAERLLGITEEDLTAIFQVTPENPLVGLEGRVSLMRALGAAVNAQPLFPEKRPGAIYDYVLSKYVEDQELFAAELLRAVLDLYSPIWPSRLTINSENLGDVWRHSAIKTGDLTHELIPFHKLSQWLTYSLLEPFIECDLKIVELNALTGLPEYRNGGLFLDLGVLRPRDLTALTKSYKVHEEFIVEWRALTVTLIDQVAPLISSALGKSPAEFPLACVLEGGTWKAGREVARELRSDGGPPLVIESDGTVF